MNQETSRRDFFRMAGGALLTLAGTATGLASEPVARAAYRLTSGDTEPHCPSMPAAGSARTDHPAPRKDVDGSNVLTADELAGNPDLIELFEGIAGIPHIADGIGCACGCAADPGIRSLLSCYERSSRMAMFCEICQAEGRVVVRLHEQGRTLEQIRAALDARFG